MRGSRAYWRIDESLQQVSKLSADIDQWFGKWRKADQVRAHTSQLQALQRNMGDVLGRIVADLPADEPGTDLGEIYDKCRSNDKRTAHMLRLWRFFADKFDQRFDKRMAPALAAADEIGWSCFAAATGHPGWTPAAPLAYFDARYAPSAFAREDTPVDLRPADALLREHVRLLPIPLIALPPVCMDRPWWLVLLAHEIGHQVQHEIGDGDFIGSFADTVASLAADCGGESGTWRGWSQELFADAFAVLTVGKWAAWAVSELERTTPERMRISADDRYPPPLVRARFMAGVGTAGGWTTGPEQPLAGPDGEIGRVASAIAADVVDFPLGGAEAPTLAQLTGLAGPAVRRLGLDRAEIVAGWQQVINGYRDALIGNDPLVADTSHVEAARLCVAGATAAWHDLLKSENGAKAEIDRLRDRSIDIVSRCRVEGTRAAELPASSVAEVSDALTTSLFAADPLALGVG
jgi:hypothetical protein